MSDEKVRPALARAIQDSAHVDDDLEGAVLVGWVVVAEWMAPSGSRWLSKVDGSANGEGCPEWQAQGYLHNALFNGQDFEGASGDDEEAP